MEWLYSDPVDPQIVARSCSTRLAVRKSQYSPIADLATEEFIEEWNGVDRKGFCSSAGPCGSLIALGVPEAKPERIAIVTKTTEFLWAVDDIFDSTESANASSTRSLESRDLVCEHQLRHSVKGRHDWGTLKTQLGTKYLLELLAIDPVRGQVVIEAVNQYRSSPGGKWADEIHDWEKWLAYRWESAGCALFLAFIVYACELDLTQRDLDTVHHIAWKAMAITVLINDLYSFEVEAMLDIQASGNISNGVWHLMKDRNITAEEAKQVLLTEKLRPLEDQFLEEKDTFSRTHRKELPQLAHYLDLVEFSASGSWYWSSQCYRYHSWRENVMRFGDRPISSFNIQELDEATSKCHDYLKAAAYNAQSSKLDEGQAETSINQQTITTSNGNGNPREHQRQYLDSKLVLAPIKYLERLPSKNVRGILIEGLSSWFTIPQDTIDRIERIVSNIHNASLLIDDIEDGSPLRRGKPAAYRVFGRAQTINSANYIWIITSEEAFKLNEKTRKVVFDELKILAIGQSYDVYWTHTASCPSFEEYQEVCRSKTGGLFSMIGRMLYSEAEQRRIIKLDDLTNFLLLLGQFFQIRDDYINLTSAKYEKEKGFAEDLDEGKFSLPMVHLLNNSPDRLMIEHILQQRSRDGRMSPEMKMLILEKMNEAGSLEFTRETLRSVETKTREALALLEEQSKTPNYILQYLLIRLSDVRE